MKLKDYPCEGGQCPGTGTCVTLVGDDALLQNQVHARHIYHINDFRFDCRFDDMVIPEHVHHNLPAPRNYAYNTRSH